MKITYPNSYVVWDLETNGLDYENDSILEIGALKVENGEIVDRKNWVMGDMTVVISEEISKLTGITYDTLKQEGRDPAECLKEFSAFIKTPSMLCPAVPSEYLPHVTHNGLRFDIPFLAHYANRVLGKGSSEPHTIIGKLNKKSIDTAALFKGGKLGEPRMWDESFADWGLRVLGTPVRGLKYNVAIACEELGISREGITQHRAAGDVELTNRIYRSLTQT